MGDRSFILGDRLSETRKGDRPLCARGDRATRRIIALFGMCCNTSISFNPPLPRRCYVASVSCRAFKLHIRGGRDAHPTIEFDCFLTHNLNVEQLTHSATLLTFDLGILLISQYILHCCTNSDLIAQNSLHTMKILQASPSDR